MSSRSNASESLGIVFWNTWYRANPEDQLKHVEKLDADLRVAGATKVILALSEVSWTGESDARAGLLERMRDSGYNPLYGVVSRIRRPRLTEGLVMASLDMNLAADPMQVGFDVGLRSQRGFASRKQRQAAQIQLPGMRITSAHLSYPRPHRNEIKGLLDATRPIPGYGAQDETFGQVIGGDFNTIASKAIVGAFEEAGFVKLIDPSSKVTVPLRNGSERGFELDHVLVSENLANHAQLEVGDQGPSNHRPLIVMVDSSTST